MYIEAEIKLGFKDVLFRPKRSTLTSRSEVDLQRTFIFRNGSEWTGVPIIAANMDTVGTFEMAEVFAKHKMLVAIHKHYTLTDWQHWLAKQPDSIYQHIMVSTGTITPKSMTSKPLHCNTTATMFLPMSCTSPFTVAINTLPLLRPLTLLASIKGFK